MVWATGSHLWVPAWGVCPMWATGSHLWVPAWGVCPTWTTGSHLWVPAWGVCPTWTTGSHLWVPAWGVSYVGIGVILWVPAWDACPTWTMGSYLWVPAWDVCPTLTLGSYSWGPTMGCVSYMGTRVIPTLGHVLHGYEGHTYVCHHGTHVLHGQWGHSYHGMCPTWTLGSYLWVPLWDMSYMDTGVVPMGPTMGRVLHGQQDHTSGSQLNTGPPWAPTPPRQGPMRTPAPSHGSHLRPGPPHLRAPPSLWVPPRPHPRVVTVLTLAHLGAHRSVPAAPPAHGDGDEGTEGPPGRQVERSPRHSTAGELGCSGDTGGTDVPVSPRRAVNVPVVSPSSPVCGEVTMGTPISPRWERAASGGPPATPLGL